MRRLKGAKRAFLGTAIAGAALLSIATEPAKAGPIDVFVGYADNLRASGFFPNPGSVTPVLSPKARRVRHSIPALSESTTIPARRSPFRTSR